MRIVIALALMAGCSTSPPEPDSASFQRAKSIMGLFIKSGLNPQFRKTDEYANSGGGTTVKGDCNVAGDSFKWTIAFDPAGDVTAFNFDSVTFLAKQDDYLSFLPDNMQYVENTVIEMPSVDELNATGVEVKVGY